MEARLQRRVQRYGWDRAAEFYEALWRAQLAPAQTELMVCAGLTPGERVLDVACGTGVTTFAAAADVAPTGSVLGVDLSGRMVEVARQRAIELAAINTRFERMDAEQLELPSDQFDVALCALGLMYVPNPEAAIREMARVVRPGGRIVLAVWGERTRCGWADIFPIMDAEVSSDVCPLFFRLGQATVLQDLCCDVGLSSVVHTRVPSILEYADDQDACDAAFLGGPVALAWSRLEEAAQQRARGRYLASIRDWRQPDGSYWVPGEFVVVAASVPG